MHISKHKARILKHVQEAGGSIGHSQLFAKSTFALDGLQFRQVVEAMKEEGLMFEVWSPRHVWTLEAPKAVTLEAPKAVKVNELEAFLKKAKEEQN